MDVTPLVGVWIEILSFKPEKKSAEKSLPSWECGLKWMSPWTEPRSLTSLPSWECGLKFMDYQGDRHGRQVTPLVGVWIEISKTQNANQS